MNKYFNLGKVKVTMERNGFPKGLVLKRNLSTTECRVVLSSYLGIRIGGREEFYDNEEYKDFKKEYTDTVNAWLRGEVEDDSIMEFAGDCSDEQLGLMNMIPILSYLKRKEIID